jgi:hypothetical protein
MIRKQKDVLDTLLQLVFFQGHFLFISDSNSQQNLNFDPNSQLVFSEWEVSSNAYFMISAISLSYVYCFDHNIFNLFNKLLFKIPHCFMKYKLEIYEVNLFFCKKITVQIYQQSLSFAIDHTCIN